MCYTAEAQLLSVDCHESVDAQVIGCGLRDLVGGFELKLNCEGRWAGFSKVLFNATLLISVQLAVRDGHVMLRVACALGDERRDCILHPFFKLCGFRSWLQETNALSVDSLRHQRPSIDIRRHLAMASVGDLDSLLAAE